MSKSLFSSAIIFLVIISVSSCQKSKQKVEIKKESFETVVEKYFRSEYGRLDEMRLVHKSQYIYWAYISVTNFSGFDELYIHRVIRKGESNDFRVSSKMSLQERVKRALNFNY